MYKSKKYHLLVLLIIYTIFLVIYLKDVMLGLSIEAQSFGFICVVLIIIISRIFLFKENAFSFYSLYYFTFVIFIGGSLFAYPFYDGELLCRDIFGLICLSNDVFSKAFFLMGSASILIEIGYSISTKNKNDKSVNHYQYSDFVSKRIIIFTRFIALFFFPLLYFSTFNSIIRNFSQGYLAGFKSSQGESYATPNAIIYLLIVSVGLGLVFTIKNKYPKFFKIYFMLFISNLLLSVMAGGRAGFVTALFMLLWLKYKDLNGARQLIKLVFYGIFIIGLINLTMIYNGRLGDSEISVADLFFRLIDSQGVSFFVFALSTTIDNYPLIAYFKTIIPGSAHLYNIFIESVPSYMAAFPNYLAWKIDPSLYYEGYALGWSILSDFYLFSFGYYPLFLIISFFWGVFLSKLSGNSIFANGLLITVMPVLFMINRATLSALIPYIILYVFSYLFLTRVKVFK